MTDEKTPEVLTLKQAAAYLQIAKSTLYGMAQRKEIPAAKVGRLWRFSRASLDDWLAGRTPQQQKEGESA